MPLLARRFCSSFSATLFGRLQLTDGRRRVAVYTPERIPKLLKLHLGELNAPFLLLLLYDSETTLPHRKPRQNSLRTTAVRPSSSVTSICCTNFWSEPGAREDSTKQLSKYCANPSPNLTARMCRYVYYLSRKGDPIGQSCRKAGGYGNICYVTRALGRRPLASERAERKKGNRILSAAQFQLSFRLMAA